MSDAMTSWLQAFLDEHGGAAGTVHTRRDEVLELRASINIPPPVVAVVEQVPRGRGMAGLALERDAPVSTCNLKTDETGDVRPGARAVDAQAAVALPVHGGDGAVRAVVGIAFVGERELSEDELAALGRAAEALP